MWKENGTVVRLTLAFVFPLFTSVALAFPSLEDLALTIGTAASDSVNPCIMSVMILLLSQLSMLKAEERAKRVGISYVIAVYISYLILGILLAWGVKLMLLSISTIFELYIKLLIVALIAIAGLINLKDFFFYGKGFSFSIPEKYKGSIRSLAARGTVPAIVVLALLVTIIEFPCSGAMYFGLITYFTSKGTEFLLLFLYLLLYNFVFVLPLIIILVAYLMGVKSERIDAIRLKYRKYFRLVMGIVLLALAYLIWVV